MGRVAIVTGGTRGIGAAISTTLRDAGYSVAANFVGSEDRARAFTAETGITAYRWDVGKYDQCTDAVARIEAALGPVDVVVNNAGITRDGTLHKMSCESWQAVIDTNLTGCFNMCRAVIEGMRARKFGRIVNQRAGRPVRTGQLRRRQIGDSRLHQGAGAGGCRHRHHRQRGGAGLYRHGHGGRRAAGRAGEDRREDSGRPPGQGA